jgi:Rps23 Pro-64 3,4-dihydroxylase Tpa1-like proline 4-hydroxylase|tara:strand:- start:1775 stop:2359 length:585 start_codon:yes stop_codon:yes gene_type:complete
MEENKLSDYIRIYDNVFGNKKNKVLSKLLKNNQFSFQEGKVFKSNNELVTDKEIRSTKIFGLRNLNHDDNTVIHYANLFASCFHHYMEKYSKENNTNSQSKIIDIQILKYEVGGFYKSHVDSGFKTPRTLSFIYLVNDDYEGGELIFNLPQNNEIIKIPPKKDILLIWPSNFLYPHKVEPVIKGVKFSVVSWAL